MNDKLFIKLQHLVPQHALSRAAGWLAATEIGLIKNTFIRWFVKRYQVDMSLAAEENPLAYPSFNDFFTRALKPDARPVDTNPFSIVCPADGAISQLGPIEAGRIFQAKGQDYSVEELLGDSELATEFADGQFATVYLSPRDYHRVHMPYGGKLRTMVSVPGELFSVNTVTAENVPRLFARNERSVAIFDTDIGPMAVVLVGAMIVAGIETVWDGQVAPFASREIATSHYPYQNIQLKKGDEMGRFKLGSTAIMLFAKDKIEWSKKYQAGTPTQMGEIMGRRK
ncbi:archaetidylserine decarboxylase [Cellvibrio japonicus]|uniref:Phosphatidylserine decarboxylase proenzyme n=1 Tax=Cellvibrio japonicus (strain Ueda107) TaxID=498211 RepID=B3PDT7_CELJU|nr:archaetidylserine decarboxylase [Cellvibrio japonicus]ACE83151.1 phosphatidylserine decarboxylase [Cellvibrio japonicus Ueda107]QEI13425.1 phosphatidylserine decarboxylase [Cellvibrio japonicus]QEI16999.1 phosphatidylserine decarboxylase [Cellvibrio japonicus]QEI20577.1 phosphatidylserine decarboxylase [Cellvibrio japonicus]